jgi:ParB family transcriptional regulator, chromosome partitioning protein
MNAEKVLEKAHDKASEKTHDRLSEKAHDKANEKVIEKRRALGRGLESLLPRPRAVTPSITTPTTTTTTIPAPAISPSERSLENAPDNGQAGTPQIPSSSATAPSAPVHTTAVQPEAASVAARLESASAGETADIPSQAAVAAVTPISPTVTNLMASTDGEEVLQLPIHLIDQNPHQTRTRFREELLKELAESIKVQGVLQPIVVRPGQEGRYRLILGERRMRASVMAGLETIPAIVKRVSEQQAAEMTLVENLQRQDLNCVEQAWAFSRMSQEFKLTQEQIGARVGMSREAVSNYMRLLTLPEGVHEMLIAGKLSYSHARALLKLNTSAQGVLWAYAKKALDEKMSVARLEELVAGLPRPPKPPGQGGARWVDPNVKAAQRRLEEILGMRVRIRDQAGRGKILIEYATIEDFDRVMEMLGGK